MILMQAPGPNETFAGMPSGSTYVSNQYCLIFITNNSAADQAALAAAGCYTLSPFGGWGTYGFPNLTALYAADLATNLVLPGQTGFPTNTMAVVYSDTTASNNGTWVKSGTGNGTGNWTYLAAIPSSGAIAAAVSAAQAATSAATAQAQATASATSATNAANSASAAATSAGQASVAPAFQNNLGTYPTALPYTITGISGGIGTGVGGTAGATYQLVQTGGPAGVAVYGTISSTGTVAGYTIAKGGLSTASTAPTFAWPAAAGFTTAPTAPTATVGTITPGTLFSAPSSDGTQVQAWGNNAGTLATAPFGGAQASLMTPTAVAPAIASAKLLSGGLGLWPGGQAPAMSIACPDGTAVALLDGQGHLVTPTVGGFERVFSPQNVNGGAALNIAPIAGEQITSIAYDQFGYVRSAIGAKGGKWVATSTGLQRENVNYFYGPGNAKGVNSLSFGYVGGEAIAEAAYDQWGYVRSAVGANGGYFLATPTGLQRANANYFTAKPLTTTYTGAAYQSSPVSVALPYKPNSAGTAYIFVGMGQSNCDGQNNNASDPYLSSAAVYPSNALMLQQGSTAGGPRVRTCSGSAVLVPLIEQVINAGGGSYQQETPISGWVNHFINLYNAANSVLPTVVGMSVAIGGRGYVGTGRGQMPLELGLQLATTALKANGFTDIVVVGAWVGSESDTNLTGMNDLWFKRNMRQLRRDFTESCFRICGMQADPEILFIQPGNVINSTPLFQPARDGMRRLDDEYGFTLAAPAYDLPLETSSDTSSNYIHRSNLSKYTTGMRLGVATVYQVANNGAWHGIKPTKAYFTSSTVISIEFDGMGVGVSGNALVLDSSGTITTGSSTYNNALTNYGFSFDDGSGSAPAISSVNVSGYVATVTLASAPTGPRKSIGYALQRTALLAAPNNINIADGPVYGARGQLRDSVARTRLADGATQYDWCPAFLINL